LPQLTFHEVQTLSLLDNFSTTQRKVAVFLREQVPQVEIARRLNVSRSYINQIVKEFQDNNLIRPIATTTTTDGKRHYNQFFDLSVALQKKLADDKTPPVTPFRTHHIIRKFKILRQSKELSQDKRTGWNKSWEMRGGKRHEYWYSGEISVSVIIHPKTIVASICKGQKIIAETAEAAEDRGIQLVINTVNKFVELQQLFGVHLEIDAVGQAVGKTHFGLAFHKAAPFATGQTTLAETWIDASVASEVEPDKLEWETVNPALATEMEIGMAKIATIDKHIQAGVTAAMPEAMAAFTEQFGGLNENIIKVKAMLQGSITLQQKEDNMMKFMSTVLNEMAMIRKELSDVKRENEELKKKG
jgi:hypothetical protein